MYIDVFSSDELKLLIELILILFAHTSYVVTSRMLHTLYAVVLSCEQP